MAYKPATIESKWQDYWTKHDIYKVKLDTSKSKYYVLDMFPYPSGRGLHVGHPLGYIASDIISRYKRLKGYNVLHPMGFDSFGLPAEQYAIEHNQHPNATTRVNIATYKAQLNKIGLSYDWTREISTADPQYYRWTQWVFTLLFNSWYDQSIAKARPLSTLIEIFKKEGNLKVKAARDEDVQEFTASEWTKMSKVEQAAVLESYRLTYRSEQSVNWCPALGTVLANEEVKEGLSERGNHPIEKRKIKQWMMRVTAYADRLHDNLDNLEWSDAMKDMQRNWIGRSLGLNLRFKVQSKGLELTTFTTRPDTIFGVTFLVIAPEHKLVSALSHPEQADSLKTYLKQVGGRSDRERMTSKKVSGVFTGYYALNPFNNEPIPIWVADYVLANYGTGIVMGVPAADDRDFRFASHFQLPIRPIIAGTETLENPCSKKHGKMINSDFLNGLNTAEAINSITEYAEAKKIGEKIINYKMRDAIFARQRYWGEPLPIYYDENGLPNALSLAELPLELPELEDFKPTGELAAPLSRVKNWTYRGKYRYEIDTMPAWAGSSWYFMRFMDPHNATTFTDPKVLKYWNQVDLYIGGTEHATSHLLYSRLWMNFLFDLEYVPYNEPFKKLFNQGMIQSTSALIHRVKGENTFISADLKSDYETTTTRVLVDFVKHNKLNLKAFQNWRPETRTAKFICNAAGDFYCEPLVEKMSKSRHNVVNPDAVIAEYGADALRLFEMFLGPIGQSKPWNTDSIGGVVRFLHKLWGLFFNEKGDFEVSQAKPTPEMYAILHKTLKRTEADLERLALNTCVSSFMICVNELQRLKCNHQLILKDLLIMIAPFAPHITEELWSLLGHKPSIHQATYPRWETKYVEEDVIEYVISVNGKKRANLSLAKNLDSKEIETEAAQVPQVAKWLKSKQIRKIIVVKHKLVNFVVQK